MLVRTIINWILAIALAYFAIRCAIEGDTRDALEIGGFAAVGFFSAIVRTRRALVLISHNVGHPPRNST
jgi:hypothetical protein